MLRQLPPTATPLPPRTLLTALVARQASAEALRQRLGEVFGHERIFLAASGRTALFLLLRALQARPAAAGRNEVVLPAYTCPSLAKVIFDASLLPRLVDLAPMSFAVDREALACAVNERTLAVVGVHPFGLPQELEPARALASEAGAFLIEDAAQALGARWRDLPVGLAGDFGLFSLGPGKALSTGGGGFVTVNRAADLESVERAWRVLPPSTAAASTGAWLRLAALTAAFHPTGWWLAHRAGAGRVGDSEKSWGYALRGLTASQIAVALAQLPCLEAYNAARRAAAERLRAALDGMPRLHLLAPPAAPHTPIYLRFPILVESPDQCDRLHRHLIEAGIGAGRMYRQTLAAIFPALAAGSYPEAERVAACLLTLPTHHYMREADLARTVEIIRESGRGT